MKIENIWYPIPMVLTVTIPNIRLMWDDRSAYADKLHALHPLAHSYAVAQIAKHYSHLVFTMPVVDLCHPAFKVSHLKYCVEANMDPDRLWVNIQRSVRLAYILNVAWPTCDYETTALIEELCNLGAGAWHPKLLLYRNETRHV